MTCKMWYPVTNISTYQGTIEDDFPSVEVGYVSTLEGTLIFGDVISINELSPKETLYCILFLVNAIFRIEEAKTHLISAKTNNASSTSKVCAFSHIFSSSHHWQDVASVPRCVITVLLVQTVSSFAFFLFQKTEHHSPQKNEELQLINFAHEWPAPL